ncbi:MAG: GNAT family N-acetyltransferase [Dorea sp.]|nr:GNAT family N-acetyltransferase [Dorea sp.]
MSDEVEKMAGNLYREFENLETKQGTAVYFRPFCKGDGEGFRQCIADFYKDGYPYKEYLDENFLLEKCASREMTVLCGLTDQGEIISTSAVRMDEEFKGSALLMLRVVKEAYRGMGIGKAQEEYLFQYADGQEGVCSLYADVMTHNSISQGSLARRGFVYCGLRMMLYRNPVMVPGLPLSEDGKMSQAVMCRKGCVQSAGILYCPAEHTGEVRRIYNELGVKCRINTEYTGPECGETVAAWKDEEEHHSYIALVRKVGKDISEMLARKMEQTGRRRDVTYLCYLNLRDPAAVYGYEKFRQAGFFYTGLKPLQENEEYMLLTHTGRQKMRYEDIHLHEDGERMLAYIKAHQT